MRRAARAARLLTTSTSTSFVCPASTATSAPRLLCLASLSRFFSAQPVEGLPSTPGTTSDEERDEGPAADFDSRDFPLPSSSANSTSDATPREPIWDKAYRAMADRTLFGDRGAVQRQGSQEEEGEEVMDERKRRLARALLEAALMKPDAEEEEVEGVTVKEEDQRSLSVGIIGAPNAGKSCLTNCMVGTKVSAVSRKTNTTTHEVLGVMTKGDTQICFFDTPGLMIGHRGYPYKNDVKLRVESAWKYIDYYDLIIVIFDVHRHLTMPDKRVITLIRLLGEKAQPKQKRILCMNKVDLVDDKKDLLKVAKEFEDLPGYERYFMVSGLKGSGVKDLIQYLIGQATRQPWEEEHAVMTEELMKNISLEVVREKMLHHIHQEIPYVIEHRLMDWKELRDGSLRVEQHFITPKPSQHQILVGKNGSKIGRIGIEANEELRFLFKRDVHLILQVRVGRQRGA
uniref:GTP-binding protein ERG n=1 Tax=Anthurium amnicola TaxID=1678845 RepID=A0A1D1ZEM0_9ARAE